MSITRTMQEQAVTVERRGHVLLMGLNRPQTRAPFNLAMIDQLAAASYELEADDALRCGVLFAHGEHFTGDLDRAEVGPAIQEGRIACPSTVLGDGQAQHPRPHRHATHALKETHNEQPNHRRRDQKHGHDQPTPGLDGRCPWCRCQPRWRAARLGTYPPMPERNE